MKTKTFDESSSVLRPRGGHIQSIKHGSGNYLTGYVVTEYGIVGIYAQGDAESFRLTILNFCLNGRNHHRTFRGKRYSRRGIVSVANRFAAEKSLGLGLNRSTQR